MSLNQALLTEFDQEIVHTRKTLERIPDDKFDWAPHPKSMKLGVLAKHVAEASGWGAETFRGESFDFMPGGKMVETPSARSRQEVLALFQSNVEAMRKALEGASDADLRKTWTLLANGQTVFSLPRIDIIRTFVLNHAIHHRAQLGVYLRLNGIPVPAIYGPSADEQG